MASQRMHKVLKWAGYGILFAVIIAIVVWLEQLNEEHSATQPIKSLSINIAGGGKQPLADVESLEQWIIDHGVYTNNMTLDKFNVGDIERTALAHNAVASANAYVGYNGDATLDITLRTPIARLRIDGYDHYITEDGYILPTVEDRTAAVLVITGNYKPLFRPDYTGSAAAVVRDSIASLERYIDSLEDAKLPFYRDLDTNDSKLREVVNESVRKGIFTSEREYRILVGELEARKVAARERHTNKKREIEAAIASLADEQQRARLMQRDVQTAGYDFAAMINLLKNIDNNSFWQAEVVQLMITGGVAKQMELSFVPRSGNFVVDLGTATDLDTKLSNLYRFYHKGLDKVGWDKYKSISLRYDGQVVCR